MEAMETTQTHPPPAEIASEGTAVAAGPRSRMRSMRQESRYASPWTFRQRMKVGLWCLAWATLFRPTPKFLYPWRVLLLKLFGAKVTGRPFVASSAVIKMPWNLVLEDRSCLGPASEVYNLARVTLRARATVAQQVYLCTGTHDFADPRLPLVVGEITIGDDAFLGVRALVLPGVEIGAGAIVGGGSVVAGDVPAGTVAAGNPCRVIRRRDEQPPRQPPRQPPHHGPTDPSA